MRNILDFKKSLSSSYISLDSKAISEELNIEEEEVKLVIQFLYDQGLLSDQKVPPPNIMIDVNGIEKRLKILSSLN